MKIIIMEEDNRYKTIPIFKADFWDRTRLIHFKNGQPQKIETLNISELFGVAFFYKKKGLKKMLIDHIKNQQS